MGAEKIRMDIITTEVDNSPAPCSSDTTEAREGSPKMNTHVEDDEQDRENRDEEDDEEDLPREEEEEVEELNEDAARYRGWDAGRSLCCGCINVKVLVLVLMVLVVSSLVYVVWVQSQLLGNMERRLEGEVSKLSSLEQRLEKAELDRYRWSAQWSELEGLGRTIKDAMVKPGWRRSIQESIEGARSSYCNVHRATRDTYDDMMLIGRHLVSSFNTALRDADQVLNDNLDDLL